MGLLIQSICSLRFYFNRLRGARFLWFPVGFRLSTKLIMGPHLWHHFRSIGSGNGAFPAVRWEASWVELTESRTNNLNNGQGSGPGLFSVRSTTVHFEIANGSAHKASN